MRWSPLLLLLFVACPALAWSPNGARLTGAFDAQVGPITVSDGAGGAFVAWTDQRDYFTGVPSNLNDCYVQRVTAAGQIAPGWPVDGLAVAVGAGHQIPATLIPDGSGGVLIVNDDTRADFGDLYLHRITGAGTLAPGWPVGGVPIAVAPGQQLLPELVTDGAAGAFVAWLDGTDPANSRSWITHVLGSGEIAPGWPPEGRLFEPYAAFVLRPLMLATPESGFLACWPVSDDTLRSARLLARRFTAEGAPDPGWPAEAVVVCERRPIHRVPRDRLVSDGTGGFYVIFADGRESGSPAEDFKDLYAQHVLGSGAIAPGWPADALPVSALSGVLAQAPTLCEDGRGGVFFTWEDYRFGSGRIFGQHLRADGQPHTGWPLTGKALTGTPGFQISPKLVWDGWNGAYMTWNNLQTGGYRSYVQHLTPSGAPAAGWPADGLPVVPIPTDQYVPTIATDGRGGAIVAWEDRRDGQNDVYAQRFVADGVVATQVSLASAEAVPDEVRVRWHVSGEGRASVERREGEGEWRVLAELTADGMGFMSLVDRDVRPGGMYDYRLVFASGSRGGEVSLVVPGRFELTLEGARPNPASGPLQVAFTLPGQSAARLELYDLSGRRLVSLEVGARGAGQHLVRLDDGALASGLYWVALMHGGRTLRERVVVVK